MAVDYLRKTHDDFLCRLEGLSPEQWSFKVAPEQWSVADCVEHVAVVESAVLDRLKNQLTEGPADPDAEQKDALILREVPQRTRRFQAPPILLPKGRWSTPDEALSAFREARRQVLEYAESKSMEYLRTHFLPHPALGPLDAYQWLLTVGAHAERHGNQLAEVLQNENCPRKE